MANVELGSSNLKEVYDAINANSGSSVDTTNLAKLNEANTFTALNTFNTLPQSDGTPTNDKDLVTKKYVDDTANNKVSKTGPETIEGVKTFSSIPLCSQRPTNGSQLANKDYVDSVAGGGGGTVDTSNFVDLTSDQTITGVKTFDDNIVTNRGINLGGRGDLSTDGDYIKLTSKKLLDVHKNIVISSSGSLELTGLNGVLKLESHSLDGLVANVYGGGNLSMTTYSNGDINMSSYDEGTININGSGGLTLRSSKNLNIAVGATGTLSMDAHTISEFKRVLGIQ